MSTGTARLAAESSPARSPTGFSSGCSLLRSSQWLGSAVAADVTDESPEEAADSAGLSGLISTSVSNAANSSGRWYALLVGIPILVYVTRSVLRALIGAHRLIWLQPRTATPKPTVGATLRLLGLLLAVPIVSTLASALRAHSSGLGVLGTLITVIPYAGIWLLAMDGLPHREAPWTALIPGALLFGLGVEVLQVSPPTSWCPTHSRSKAHTALSALPRRSSSALYLISRLIVAAAVVNATLWERRSTREPRAAAGRSSRAAASRARRSESAARSRQSRRSPRSAARRS